MLARMPAFVAHGDAIPPALLKDIKRHGWPVAQGAGYPTVMGIEPDLPLTALSRSELSTQGQRSAGWRPRSCSGGSGPGGMGSDGAVQALQSQRTHEGDHSEVVIEVHQLGVVVRGQGGHQQIKAQHGAADLAAGLAQVDRPLPQIGWAGERGQGGELGLQLAGLLRPGWAQRLEVHRFGQVGTGTQREGGDQLFQGRRATGPGEADSWAGVEQWAHGASS